jgi:hypothetical protein
VQPGTSLTARDLAPVNAVVSWHAQVVSRRRCEAKKRPGIKPERAPRVRGEPAERLTWAAHSLERKDLVDARRHSLR